MVLKQLLIFWNFLMGTGSLASKSAVSVTEKLSEEDALIVLSSDNIHPT